MHHNFSYKSKSDQATVIWVLHMPTLSRPQLLPVFLGMKTMSSVIASCSSFAHRAVTESFSSPCLCSTKTTRRVSLMVPSSAITGNLSSSKESKITSASLMLAIVAVNTPCQPRGHDEPSTSRILIAASTDLPIQRSVNSSVLRLLV